MKPTTKQIAALTEMIAYAEARAAYWEAEGDMCVRGTASRRECFATCTKWQQTAQTLREELASLS